MSYSFRSGFLLLLLLTSLNADEIPVFIFAGQSIAMNSETDSELLPPEMLAAQTNVLFYNARTSSITEAPTQNVNWVTYQPPTGEGYPSDSIYSDPTGSFGPEITAARSIAQTFYGSGKIAVYKYAVGATSLHCYYNPVTPGPLYSELLAFLTDAMACLPSETGYTGKIAGVFWTQGESDALDGEPYCDEYGSNLVNFVTVLRQVFDSPRLPFVYGRITPAWPNSASVRAGQENLTNVLSDVFMVDADDLLTATRHYDNDGTMALGDRYANGFASIMQSRLSLALAYQGRACLHVLGLPKSAYHIESSSDLKNWTKSRDICTDVVGLGEDVDAQPTGAPLNFYRLR